MIISQKQDAQMDSSIQNKMNKVKSEIAEFLEKVKRSALKDKLGLI